MPIAIYGSEGQDYFGPTSAEVSNKEIKDAYTIILSSPFPPADTSKSDSARVVLLRSCPSEQKTSLKAFE